MTAKRYKNPRSNFISLLKKIRPTKNEISKAYSYQDSCKTKLKNTFHLRKFIKIGSHSRGAAIRHNSDLDYLVQLSINEARWGGDLVKSNNFIDRVGKELKDRYLTTDIRKDRQAIVINFGSGQHSMDVVPAVYGGFVDKKLIYKIPDGSGGWMKTAPEAHTKYIKEQSKKSGSKLAKVGQLLRYWKHSRVPTEPLSSFYIDLILAQSEICTVAKSYPEIICDFFRLMKKNKCSGLVDPVGISGTIRPVKTKNQLTALQTIINLCYEQSAKALVYEEKKEYEAANKCWDMVFNGYYLPKK